MRKSIVSLILVALFVCMVQPAYAGQPIFKTLTTEEIENLNMNDNWNKMKAIPEPAVGQPPLPFEKVEYYVKSTGATSGIRYRTKQITFTVGKYGPATYGADQLRSRLPGPGETIYDKVILNRDFFMDIFGSTVGQALDTENLLYVGAVIEIYNANTGQVLETITSPEECQTKGAAQKFGPTDITDMKSRWQQVKLRESQLPDFFVCFAPQTEWTGIDGPTESGAPHTKSIVPARVGNCGNVAGTTDFAASWYGNGWDKNKLVYFKDNIYLEPGQIVDVPFEVEVPEPGQENRLVIITNLRLFYPESDYDNNTPKEI